MCEAFFQQRYRGRIHRGFALFRTRLVSLSRYGRLFPPPRKGLVGLDQVQHSPLGTCRQSLSRYLPTAHDHLRTSRSTYDSLSEKYGQGSCDPDGPKPPITGSVAHSGIKPGLLKAETEKQILAISRGGRAIHSASSIRGLPRAICENGR